MASFDWIKEFPASITVADRQGTIIAMNDRACKAFEEEGGAALIGTNLLACHPEPARTTLEGLMAGRKVNSYTIEKQGKWKMIYQAPWFEGGVYSGFVEIAMEIPPALPHFVRKG